MIELYLDLNPDDQDLQQQKSRILSFQLLEHLYFRPQHLIICDSQFHPPKTQVVVVVFQRFTTVGG
jgi:hypothetical protein